MLRMIIVLLVLLAVVGGVWYFYGNQLFIAEETITFDKVGNLVRDNPGLERGVWHLVYEEPGSPGLVAPLTFDEKSDCSGAPCDPATFVQGERVRIEGVAQDAKVIVRSMVPQTGESGFPVTLYYYNSEKDKDEEGNILCSEEGLVAVERVLSISELVTSPGEEAIRLLLRGELTTEERAAGITTEYPLPGFELASSTLTENGELTLIFRDPQNKTTGGSCRVSVLRHQIEATAKQFTEVTSVRFEPEELFQP